MPALEIQNYLRFGWTLDHLKADVGIRSKPHPLYPNLIHLTYDQIDSPSGHPLVNECRGLILDSERNWDVVAFPFRRFGNHGESWTDSIDWQTARVTEKIDGSLIVLWFYQGRWNISTKGSPDAGGPVGDFDFSFATLFWETLKSQLPEWYDHIERYSEADALDGCRMSLSASNTYMFELCSPYNRIVCSYGAANKITLIGVRANYGDFLETDTGELSDYFPVVREYPISSLLEALETAAALDPIATEGFVVVDANFNRVKIKSPKYVELHHLRTGVGIRPMIRLIRMGEVKEFISYFPEYQGLVDEISTKLDAYVAEVNETYSRLRSITDRKAFALEAVKTKHSSMLFGLHQGKLTDVRNRMLYDKRPDDTFFITDDKFVELIGISVPVSSLFVVQDS